MEVLGLGSRPGLPPRPVFPDGRSGITISRLSDKALLDEVRGIAGDFFPRDTVHYLEMDADAYRRLIRQAQEELNHRALTRRL